METKTQMDNTVELKELVYAPLEAISAANIRLSSNIADFLASTGDMATDAAGRPVVQLQTIQMQYEQLRSDSGDNTVADRIGLEIPLLSIYPLSALKVSKTKVSFSAEIRSMKTSGDGIKIYTQVCSPKQRAGANLPRFCYEVELDSAPVSEGLARFIDTLNAQAIPKRLYSKPLDDSGKRLTGKELEDYNRRMELNAREAELTGNLNEVKELLRVKNNALTMETGMDYDEYRAHIACTGEPDSHAELCAAIEEYCTVINNLETELAELRNEKVMQRIQPPGEPEGFEDAPQ